MASNTRMMIMRIVTMDNLPLLSVCDSQVLPAGSPFETATDH